MEFEIFRDQSLNKIITDVDNLEEWKALAEELGLTKQTGLTSNGKSPVPYPFINTSYNNIIKLLAPNRTEVKDYGKTTIPLEVMREIKLCNTEDYFSEIEIHYDDKSPDPFVIGKIKAFYLYKSGSGSVENEEGKRLEFRTKSEAEDLKSSMYPNHSVYGDDKESYLIAKFGEHNKTWEELKKIAIDRVIEKYGATLNNKLEDLQRAVKKLKDNAVLYVNAEINESELKGGYW